MVLDKLKQAKKTISSIYEGITTPAGGCCGLQVPAADRQKLRELTQAGKKKAEKASESDHSGN